MNRVAVLMCAYNDQDGVNRSLASLENDPAPFDIMVVDDGSKPALTVPGSVGPHRVTLLRREPNGGVETARNPGVEELLARQYTYIAILDAGDISLPGRFEAETAFLDAHPDYAIVGSPAEVVDVMGRPMGLLRLPQSDADVRRATRYNNNVLHSSMMMRASVFTEVGVYRDVFPIAEDYDLVFRVLRHHKVANLPQPFVKYEMNPDSVSRRRPRTQMLSALRIQLRYFDPADIHSYLGVLASAAMLSTPHFILSAGRRALLRLMPSKSVFSPH